MECDGAGLTVGLSLAPATVLDLETGEVRVGLDLLDEGHLENGQRVSTQVKVSSITLHGHPPPFHHSLSTTTSSMVRTARPDPSRLSGGHSP